MTLCSSIEEPSSPSPTSATTNPQTSVQRSDASASELISRRDRHALLAAALLRDYRQTYGLKVTLPAIFQAQAAASFYLLLRLNTAAGQEKPVFLSAGDSVREDVTAAFEETFRCLLGSSTEVMVARGVLRMLIYTAMHLSIDLPQSAVSATQNMQVWQSSDIDRISSEYPNYAIARNARPGTEVRMESLLKRFERTAVSD